MTFNSFFMGGFECSTHRDENGRRLDLIASTRHDEFAELDYRRLVDIGMLTCRDGLRWHLIETRPFVYDFASLRQQVAAAQTTGMQIIWDYFHYGFPDDLDIFSDAFIERFVAFSRAATEYLIAELGSEIAVCPVNEISFFSWVGGHNGKFYPYKKRRGDELKRQLVRAAAASIEAIREIAPAVRILATDPAIHVVSNSDHPDHLHRAEEYRQSQFEAFDMLLGKRDPELGGSNDHLDIIGLNYYFHNQWHHSNRQKISRGHELYRPLSEILVEYKRRYDKPILIAETGIEDDERPDWFRYICEQVTEARSMGVSVEGVCLYPIVNHPGWADDRHCHNGLWDYADDVGTRAIYQPLAEEIEYQLRMLQKAVSA